MDLHEEQVEELQGAISETLQQHGPEHENGYLLTGWVVVTEWMDTGGGKFLARCHSDGMTDWQRDGMLEHAGRDWDDDDDY